MFNTLKYAKILEEVGFSREQAETSIRILVEIMEEKLASKQDFQELKQELKVTNNEEFKELAHRIERSKLELTIRMGGMIAAAIAIITGILKFNSH